MGSKKRSRSAMDESDDETVEQDFAEVEAMQDEDDEEIDARGDAQMSRKRRRGNDGQSLVVSQRLNNYTEAVERSKSSKKQKKQKKKQVQQKQAAAAHQASSVSGSSKVLVKHRVDHKRTLYFLEQLMLKYKMEQHVCSAEQLLSFREVSRPVRGWELIFRDSNRAHQFANFVASALPADVKKQHVSQGDDNPMNASTNYVVEIAPICKYDLVCLPKRLYQSMGALGPVLICEKVKGGAIQLLDPKSLKLGEVDGAHYFVSDSGSKGDGSAAAAASDGSGIKYSFVPLFTKAQLVEYTVLDVDASWRYDSSTKKSKNGKYVISTVTICKTNEIGHTDAEIEVPCHFAHELEAGDLVLGYDIKNANLNDDVVSSYKESQLALPDVVLIKKQYELERPDEKIWTLKPWRVQHDEDYDQFLEELEEDKDLRAQINLYKKADAPAATVAAAAAAPAPAGVAGRKIVKAAKSKRPKDKVMLEELMEALSLF